MGSLESKYIMEHPIIIASNNKIQNGCRIAEKVHVLGFARKRFTESRFPPASLNNFELSLVHCRIAMSFFWLVKMISRVLALLWPFEKRPNWLICLRF